MARSEFVKVSQEFNLLSSYDNSLFFTLLLTSFHGLMQLGEITWPDKTNLQDYRKVIMRNFVHIDPKSFQFVLPGHKADHFFEGSLIIIQSTDLADDPYRPFVSYLSQRDHRFPLHPQLWLKENGMVPTWPWFLQHLHKRFVGNVSRHSLRAGGATALAETGIPPHMIQTIGRWSSDAFQIYICRHPVLLAALIYVSGHHHNHFLSSLHAPLSLTNNYAT